MFVFSFLTFPLFFDLLEGTLETSFIAEGCPSLNILNKMKMKGRHCKQHVECSNKDTCQGRNFHKNFEGANF